MSGNGRFTVVCGQGELCSILGIFKEQSEMRQNLSNLIASIHQNRVVNATCCVYTDVMCNLSRPTN